jgi:stress response protein YsnF
VVEVRETSEEPVVAKTARVVEEVVVGREAIERTETVRDTVRREEVEIAKDGEVKR